LTYIDAPVDRIFLLPQMGDRYNATFYQPTGFVASASWNWSINQNLFLESKIASQVSDEDTSRPFPPEVKAQDPDFLPNPALGPFSPNNNDESYVQNYDNTWHNGWIFAAGFGTNEFPRDQLNVAVTQFLGTNHELKYGADLQQVEWNQDVQRRLALPTAATVRRPPTCRAWEFAIPGASTSTTTATASPRGVLRATATTSATTSATDSASAITGPSPWGCGSSSRRSRTTAAAR
jgi:hypothetical protein